MVGVGRKILIKTNGILIRDIVVIIMILLLGILVDACIDGARTDGVHTNAVLGEFKRGHA